MKKYSSLIIHIKLRNLNQNPEDIPIISTDYYDTLKSIEESLAPYMHNNTKDSGFKSDSGL